jgi:hypothetical protein
MRLYKLEPIFSILKAQPFKSTFKQVHIQALI